MVTSGLFTKSNLTQVEYNTIHASLVKAWTQHVTRLGKARTQRVTLLVKARTQSGTCLIKAQSLIF